MQRRSTALLIQRALLLSPKRPMEGMGTAAAAVAPAGATPASGSARHPPPPPPRQASTTHNVTAKPQPPSRPTTLVTPPSSTPVNTGEASNNGGNGGGLRKKKIIRRIVKRKKSSGAAVGGGSGGSTSGNAAGSMSTSVADTTAATAAMAATTATASQPTSRAQIMLNKIRKQPEGALTEEEEKPFPGEDDATPAAAAVKEENVADQSLARTKTEEEDDGVQATATGSDATESTAAEVRYAEDMKALHDETDESAGTTTTASAHRKTAMVKGYRIDEVSNLCSPSDAVFARRLPSGGCQFFAWPGTPLTVASKAILSMPDTIRTVHAVFGRPGTPMDIVMDIDCQVPQEYWTMTKIRPFQKKLLDDVLSVLKEEIEKIGESIETQVVLQSPSLKKASFHVHTKLKDAAFADFNSLHGFLCKFQERMPNVDMQIYRPHGMLRMFSCMKENHTSAIVVFDDPTWNIGFKDGKVSDEEAALHSVCVRDPATFTRTLTFESPRSYYGGALSKDSGEAGAEGEERRGPPQVRLPRTEKEAVANASRWLRMANEVEVGEWRTWIGLGLCAYRVAYHFRNAKGLPRPAMEELLDAWAEASRKCPLKYHQGECETRWAAFSPDKLSDTSGWWGAYKRLGRLEAAAAEAAAEDAADRARCIQRRDTTTSAKTAAKTTTAATAAARPEPAGVAAAAVAGADAASTPAAKEGVTSASRKLKLKKRTMRSAS